MLETDWVTEVLARGRTSGLMRVRRINSSKEMIKRAGHSVAMEFRFLADICHAVSTNLIGHKGVLHSIGKSFK